MGSLGIGGDRVCASPLEGLGRAELHSASWRSLATMWLRASEASLHSPADALEVATEWLKRDLGVAITRFVFSRRVDAEDDAPLLGWRPVHVTRHGTNHEEVAYSDDWTRRRARDIPHDPTVQAQVAHSGTLRVVRPRSLVTHAQWEAAPTRELLLRFDTSDQLVAATALDHGMEVYMVLERRGDTTTLFSARDALHARVALEGLVEPIRRYARSLGLLDGRKVLTPRERTVSDLLLAGRTETQIARDLGLTRGSAHQVVLSVYRSLGVHSRAELISFCLTGRRD